MLPGLVARSCVMVRGPAAPGRPGETSAADGRLGPPTRAARRGRRRNAAARRLGIDRPTPPWLPPLPAVVTAGRLGAAARPGPRPRRDSEGCRWAWSTCPRNSAARRSAGATRSAGTSASPVGPRSGRSTALVTLAVGLAEIAAVRGRARARAPGRPGPCAALAAASPRRHGDRLRGPGAEPTAAAPPAPPGRRRRGGTCRTVVLVDGWESLEEALSGIDHGAPVDDLHRLLRDGPAARRQVRRHRWTGDPVRTAARVAGAATGAAHAGPAGSHPRRGRAVARRHSRTPGKGDRPPDRPRAAAGPPGVGPAQPAARRGSRRGPGRPTPTVAGSPGPSRRDDPRGGSRRCRSRSRSSDLPPDREGLWLGLGGDDAAPTTLPLGPGRRRLVVAGPNRSGRSSSLADHRGGLAGAGTTRRRRLSPAVGPVPPGRRDASASS